MAIDSSMGSGGAGPNISAERSHRLSKGVVVRLKWYLFGVLTPFLVLACLASLGVKPPKSKSEVLVDKWRLKECNDALLMVSVPSEPNIYFTLGIERTSETGGLKEIGVTKRKGTTPDMGIFVYKVKGQYGKPMACYSSPEQGMVWRDLNADSVFDQRVDYRNREMEIYVCGRWIKGLGKKEVETDEGLFAFDPNNGEWKKIEPSVQEMEEVPRPKWEE